MPEKKSDTPSPHPPVERAWALSPDEVITELKVNSEEGLSGKNAARRLQKYGPNRLGETKQRSVWAILWGQIKNILMILLTAAAVLAFAFGQPVEGVAILAVVVLNIAIGFLMEWRAVRSMEALQKMGTMETNVVRDGHAQQISAEKLVPGDIVLLNSGDVIAADLRILEANKLQANESALTGESLPATKQIDSVDQDAPLADRKTMLYKGTAITRGSGRAVVAATGMATELGVISSLTQGVKTQPAKLEHDINRLGYRLIWLTLIIAVLIIILGVVTGRELLLIIETAIALAVATVPEGLPIVATIALAHGMWQMARQNALIRKLAAVQTLGSTGIILTDKTGTLTENKMTVSRISLPDLDLSLDANGKERYMVDGSAARLDEHESFRHALTIGALCNNASLPPLDKPDSEPVGEPMEVALLASARMAGIDVDAMRERYSEEREEAFDPEKKMMATYNRVGNSLLVHVKGAPEAVLNACTHLKSETETRPLVDEERAFWAKQDDRLAEEGLRVLALASKEVESAEEAPYEKCAFVGLLGLLDPARSDVRNSVEECHEAGVRVIMVTGDHKATAEKIGKSAGLLDKHVEHKRVDEGKSLRGASELHIHEAGELLRTAVFARTSPEQKLDLIDLHQRNGSVVAMIGDGVNDAPALKKADIGVAMGKRGTQVAKEAADMVLQDDRFGTITLAIRLGRAIFGNIRKFITYLLALNMGEILAVGAASIAGMPLPILPLQILYLNLVTDVFPALALGVGQGEPHIMQKPPRDPEEPILTRGGWFELIGYGILIAALTITALVLAQQWLELETEEAVSISYLTMGFSQFWHVLNVRARGSGWFKNEIVSNPWVWPALAMCIVLVLLTVYVPFLSTALSVRTPDANGWLLIGGLSALMYLLGQIPKSIGATGKQSA